jgi:hypothetical protein
MKVNRCEIIYPVHLNPEGQVASAANQFYSLVF